MPGSGSGNGNGNGNAKSLAPLPLKLDDFVLEDSRGDLSGMNSLGLPSLSKKGELPFQEDEKPRGRC